MEYNGIGNELIYNQFFDNLPMRYRLPFGNKVILTWQFAIAS